MRSRLSILSFILLLLLSITSAHSQESRGIIRGTVRDSVTGETIPFANVFLEGTRIGASASVRGFFLLPEIPAGSYVVRATAVGFEPKTRQVTVRGGVTVETLVPVEEHAVA